MNGNRSSEWQRRLAFAQGAYYGVTGLWPLVSLETFMLVTGRKTDTWLVQTVGVLVLAIALPLLVAAIRRQIALEVRVLAVGTAIAFLLVDVAFYIQGRIGAIYLADAALELLLVLAWLALHRFAANPQADAALEAP